MKLRLLTLVFAAACIGTPPEPQGPIAPAQRRVPPPLPDSTGWGGHVLALELDRDGALWAGTFGHGIYVQREPERGQRDSAGWEHITPRANDSAALSWGFVNSFAFPRDGSAWYGTIGNGFGRSTDGGRTWQNWTVDQLGPQWQYVAHNGMRSLGDTVYIATADGLRISGDGGRTWRCVVAQDVQDGGASPVNDGCGQRLEALPSDYLLSMDVGPDRAIWLGHLQGVSVSQDGGRTWRHLSETEGIPKTRVRAIAATPDSMVWIATEEQILVDSLAEMKFVPATINLPGWNRLPGKPRAIVPTPGVAEPSIVLSFGLAAGNGLGNFRIYFVAAGDEYRPAADMWSMTWTGPPLWPVGAGATGLARVLAGHGPAIDYAYVRNADPPVPRRHLLFERPIADAGGNPYIDATYRYGSTMGGNFQEHMGVEFNNPAGTPVRAIGDGTVVFAGAAEAGSQTVAIRHDEQVGERTLFSVYYHNRALEVQNGQRVRTGDVIARVGNTGRATNEHLHLEVHAAPAAETGAIVNPGERFPPHTVNPEMFLRPLTGTGTVAGRVLSGSGDPIEGARVYGIVLPYPAETPFSFAETYGARSNPDPVWNENFAVNDVPPGTYLLGVDIDGQRVWRRIRVEPGLMTWVEFRPST
jgi:hypothetical protein